MQQTVKTIDAAEAFKHADAFFRSLERLHHTSLPQQVPSIAAPMVVLSAFASELYLKCLLYDESVQTAPIREHLLYELFTSLSQRTQKRLKELWEENTITRKEILDRLDESAGKKVPRDLDSNLRSGSDAFRLVRYLYEGGVDFEFNLSDLPIILRRVILELKPGWEPSDQWIKVCVEVSDKVLGSDIEFQDGSSVRLDADQTKDKVFRETRTGKLFNTLEMISNLLMKTNTRKQDLIKPAAVSEAFTRGICVGKPSLDIGFTPGSMELCLGGTVRDIKRIDFDVQLTVRPQKSS